MEADQFSGTLLVEGVVLSPGIPIGICVYAIVTTMMANADLSRYWRYAGGRPQFVGGDDCGLPRNEQIELLHRKGYDMCLVPRLKTCLWVAYALTPSDVSNRVGRVGRFRQDEDLGDRTVDPKDFAGRGFDRGHMAPSQDMQYCLEVSRQSFWMGNITPQTPRLNRGDWKRLEGMIHRKVVPSADGEVSARRVFVLTGPVFSNDVLVRYEREKAEYESNGKKGVSPLVKPRAFWKIYKYGAIVEAVIMYQKLPDDGDDAPTGAQSVSVGEIEKLTGIRFFGDMNEDLRFFYLNYQRPLYGQRERKDDHE